jgi:hypothetical protein
MSRFSGNILNDNKGGPGRVKVQTTARCGDVCLMSDLPILAGQYGTFGKTGVYYEALIHRMEGTIAIGVFFKPNCMELATKTYARDCVPSLSRISPSRLE